MSIADSAPLKWAKVIDHTRCIGCHACSTACKSENAVPLGVNRTYVKSVDIGEFPAARRAFQVTRCNQCDHPPCVTACPTSAMFRRSDGIVDFDKSICIGCKACIAACPYDAIFINPDDHSAEKCNFCAHRIEVGLEPACVVVCPTEAIIVGDLNDPQSRVARYVNRDAVAVRRPEKDTRPKLFYKGAHQATLDPLAAKRPDGGLFMWSEQAGLASGHPGSTNNVAAAILSYDVPHSAPWGWHVSAYVWTKAIASGSYLVAAVLLLLGRIDVTSTLWRWTTPVVSAIFLIVTTLLLIFDLEHPERFYLILLRPQWRSWLVRGGIILALFGALIAVHLFLPSRAVAIAGIPISIAAGTYTAWLFAQAKARDLWQSPLLPLQHLLACLMAGAAMLTLFGVQLGFALPIVTAIHLAVVAAEVLTPHVTAHARLAIHEMVRGRYRIFFAIGFLLMLFGIVAPPPAGAALILIGLLAYEHAHVGAGQAVPLA
ncbi:MAG TPA: 4Fe-4S dicluster domain-containing protein [Thermoanaerobaculia bacterium]|nr:4Fe-4S dicluster domain-containing protein [Thermoanaerobaculia bacterium]